MPDTLITQRVPYSVHLPVSFTRGEVERVHDRGNKNLELHHVACSKLPMLSSHCYEIRGGTRVTEEEAPQTPAVKTLTVNE
jgi:hypothetical protein